MEHEFLIKVHKSYRWVVAICDLELAGKVFEDGEKQLDLSGDFFAGEQVNLTQLNLDVERARDEDATFYIVGEHAITYAKGIGLIDDSGVGTINDVPYALVLL